MKKYNKPSELTKKLIALGLAGAIGVFGLTACNTNDNTNTSTTSAYTETTTSKTENPIEQEQGLDKVAALVKKMINETYAQNFDYYVKSVTITGINVKKAEAPAVDYAPGVYADYQEQTESIIDISYVAESVNKTTGEEKVVSNDISYIVSSEAASEVAQQGVDNVELNTLADAIVESTQEKIEAEEITGTNENDNIAGVQLSKKEELVNLLTQKYLDSYMQQEYMKEYTDNGFKLINKVQSINVWDSDAGIELWLEGAENGYGHFITFKTPTSHFQIQKVYQDGVDYGIQIMQSLPVVSIAINESTGEKVYLASSALVRYGQITEEEYQNIIDMVDNLSGGKVKDLMAQYPSGASEQPYALHTEVCDSRGLTEEVYQMFLNWIQSHPSNEVDGVGYPYIYTAEQLTITQKMFYDAMEQGNDPLVYIANPTNALNK